MKYTRNRTYLRRGKRSQPDARFPLLPFLFALGHASGFEILFFNFILYTSPFQDESIILDRNLGGVHVVRFQNLSTSCRALTQPERLSTPFREITAGLEQHHSMSLTLALTLILSVLSYSCILILTYSFPSNLIFSRLLMQSSLHAVHDILPLVFLSLQFLVRQSTRVSTEVYIKVDASLFLSSFRSFSSSFSRSIVEDLVRLQDLVPQNSIGSPEVPRADVRY